MFASLPNMTCPRDTISSCGSTSLLCYVRKSVNVRGFTQHWVAKWYLYTPTACTSSFARTHFPTNPLPQSSVCSCQGGRLLWFKSRATHRAISSQNKWLWERPVMCARTNMGPSGDKQKPLSVVWNKTIVHSACTKGSDGPTPTPCLSWTAAYTAMVWSVQVEDDTIVDRCNKPMEKKSVKQ